MSEGQEKEPFKVRDRRRFDAEGNERDDQVAEEAESPSSDPPAADALPKIDFATFILSLSTSVMMHLGDTSHLDGGEQKDLALARQTIDIIAMLKDKTAGNLTPDERKLIDELLYDLRLRYVQAQG